MARAQPDFIEVNISCPNVGSEFGEPFAGSAESAASVTESVKRALVGSGIPLIVKLAPNVPSIARIAHAVVEAGADALCAVNTMPGMLIDAESGQSILANRSGGLSGPALKPVALKCVYDIHTVVAKRTHHWYRRRDQWNRCGRDADGWRHSGRHRQRDPLSRS